MTNKVHQTGMNWPQRPEPPSRRDVLIEAIAREEERLATLEAKQADSKRRLAALQAELAVVGSEPGIRVRLPITVEDPVPRTSAEKIKLFRSLFRGREDVGRARVCFEASIAAKKNAPYARVGMVVAFFEPAKLRYRICSPTPASGVPPNAIVSQQHEKFFDVLATNAGWESVLGLIAHSSDASIAVGGSL